MGADGETSQSLQDEFDQHLAEMKPHVLKLQHKHERQRCALWIKKLCENPQGSVAKKTRNSYSKVILLMLKAGRLEPPFTSRPGQGPLPELSPQLAAYLGNNAETDVPTWVANLSHEEDQDAGHLVLGQPLAASSARSSSGQAAGVQVVQSAGSKTRHSPPQHQQRLESAGYEWRSEISKKPSEPLCKVENDPVHQQKQQDWKLYHKTMGGDAPGTFRINGLDEVTRRREARGFHFSSDEDEDDKVATRAPPARTSSPYSRGDGYRDDEERRIRAVPVRASSPYSSGRGDGYVASGARLSLAAAAAAAQEKEFEVRLKMLEARLHEEKLQMQQKHDDEVQKILDRKNVEIEDVKGHYRNKIKEQEDAIAKLEKKVHSILKDSSIVRESKDQQITELRRLAEESAETRQNEAERRAHDLVAEHEQDKFELQKQHTRAIHELMDETGARLAKMEDDYKQQASVTAEVIRELESKIQHLTSDAERVTNAKNSLEQQKVELEVRVEQLHIESSQYRVKFEALSGEHLRSIEEHRRAVELAREKHESQMGFLRREQSVAASKAADVAAELEQRIALLRQAAQENEAQRQQQAHDSEMARRQEATQAERQHEKKVRALQKEAEQLTAEHGKSMSAVEAQLKEKDAELQRQREQLRQQAAAAERALAELKSQVERHSERMYAETKQQMTQVEEDLLRSKSLREQQAKEYDAHLKELKRAQDRELQALRGSVEQEKLQLQAYERQQRDLLLSAHSQEIGHLTLELNTEKARLEELLKESRAENERQGASQSDEIAALRDELVSNEQLRRQQLTELGLLRDEERQRQTREHEREATQLRAEAERQRHELQRAHAIEAERAVERADARLKEVEKDYIVRLNKSTEALHEAQAKAEQLRAGRRELTDHMEMKLAEMATKCEEEKRALRRHTSSTMVALQEDIESQHAQLRQAERRLRDVQAEHEERLLRLTIEYETKMKGLMPTSARQQLEDTISSLKNQVVTLKQRISLLQDELLETRHTTSGSSLATAMAVASRDSRPTG